MAEWCHETLPDQGALFRLVHRLREAFPNLDPNHDLEWITVAHDWPKNEVLVLTRRTGNAISGVASFLVSKAPLVYALGPLTLATFTVLQFKLYQGITVATANGAETIGDCFQTLARAMRDGGVVFAGAVPTGSDLHRQLVDPSSPLRRHFHVLPWGGETQHCVIRWDGSYEAYLASIGKTTRKDLRRSAKALLSDPSVRCELRCFRFPAEVETFLRDAIAISDKTYQKRDLGLGISWGGSVERVIRFAASSGSFLGYILYIDEAPAAFKFGFMWGKTLVMKQTGYDPKWAHRQIGSVMFTEVLRDYERLKLTVDCLDFMPDVNLFKLRTANDRRQIRHFYLFPRTPVGALRYFTLKATDWLSRAVGSFVKKPRQGELEKYLARIETGARKA